MNRIEDEVCLSCGTPLIYPFNKFRLCTECLNVVKKAVYETKMHKEKGRGKPIGGRFNYPLTPLGKEVE
jgi:hypothetical protein